MSAPSFDLQGRLALVIGGGTGIGQAIALGLAGAGADVALAGRRSAPLQATAERVRALGRQAWALPADATHTDEIDALLATLRRHARVPDVLVNAQGTMALRDSTEVDEETFARLMDTNVRSVWFACTRFGAAMLERGSGCIVNIASMASFRGFARNAVYAVGKHGVNALTQSLAAEWAARGVRVNAIAPGFFITDLNRSAMTDDRQARALARIPMNRFGRLDELAGAAVYLASPAAAYVTGCVLPVDGGFLASGM